MTGTDPTPPNEASTRSPSSEGAEPARPLLDIFEGLIAPNTQEEDLTSDSLEIEVKESNVRVRFVGDTQAPRIGSESDVLPGRLEIELQTASGRTIDTITMSQLTMKSLKLVLNKLTRTDPRERFLGLTRMMGDPFLTQGKLRELLIVAGSELVQIASALGNNPSDIAANYSGQFSRARSGEDDRDRYLTMLERNSTFSVVLHGLAQARALGIGKVLVPANAPSIVDEVSRSRGDMNVIWVVPKAAVQEVNLSEDESGDIVYFSTNPKITPEAEQRLALFYALARGHLGVDDRVLCLKGASSSPVLTGYEIIAPARVFSWISEKSLRSLQAIPESSLEVIERVVDVALKFAREGREGKSFGTTFVIGEPSTLKPYLDQVMHNPLIGLAEEERSIHNPSFLRTLRAVASVENAVIIRPDGVVVSGWTYIVADTSNVETREGWGARHVSAAAITSVTDAIAVTISESSSDVTLMWEGKPILELSPR